MRADAYPRQCPVRVRVEEGGCQLASTASNSYGTGVADRLHPPV